MKWEGDDSEAATTGSMKHTAIPEVTPVPDETPTRIKQLPPAHTSIYPNQDTSLAILEVHPRYSQRDIRDRMESSTSIHATTGSPQKRLEREAITNDTAKTLEDRPGENLESAHTPIVSGLDERSVTYHLMPGGNLEERGVSEATLTPNIVSRNTTIKDVDHMTNKQISDTPGTPRQEQITLHREEKMTTNEHGKPRNLRPSFIPSSPPDQNNGSTHTPMVIGLREKTSLTFHAPHQEDRVDDPIQLKRDMREAAPPPSIVPETQNATITNVSHMLNGQISDTPPQEQVTIPDRGWPRMNRVNEKTRT